ncbi:Hypothetical predicted protein [Olea europaea subsp. europaea]|uniref:F-box/LRR-repeat protein 15/At3g58940/PEG3-like LRR domain-containing protein n=1 Tax=Olea europaea subsp. europaea TaxID=158383 RepID=A0A8S0PY46_OLEEU|nr:Hypothetical predicted protein [Olea europaea subsp. europaea]
MRIDFEQDLISDLPQSIIETILINLPIRDATDSQVLSIYLVLAVLIRYRLVATFLSRKDIKELVLQLGEGKWFRAPSSLFSCKNLNHLELGRCELDPLPSFKGFFHLNYLNLQQVLILPYDIEFLIASYPLLESLTLSYFNSLELTVSAPNLKYLILEGEFKDICLVNTPLLVFISIAM